MAELICIVCPKGCHLQVTQEEDGYHVKGNACPRGKDYGIAERTNPTRVVTSTVRIHGAAHKRCPVKTDGAIPKGLLFEAMEQLEKVDLQSPVKCGDIIIENVCGTEINFVATRNM